MTLPLRRSTALRWGWAAPVLAVAITLAVVLSTTEAGAGSKKRFGHVGSFFAPENTLLEGLPITDPTSAEIVDITPDGDLMVYTDSFTESIGLVDISDPSSPQPLGLISLPAEPTSVAIHEDWALVSINTSPDFDNPSGELLVIDLGARLVVKTFDLGGQPDAVAVSPNGTYAAIAIENERDEDESGGIIPQLPAGFLQVLDLSGAPAAWTLTAVDLTGLAATAPSDPEPEFVDINHDDLAVVTLQENNHLVIVDLDTKTVVNHFSAGTTDIRNIDNTEEELGPQDNGLIELNEHIFDRRREPDAVAWIDSKRFATANEGDYEDENGEEGGSRGFTIFNIYGDVEFDSGNRFEHAVVSAGHYPEFRSENKGSEPEGVEVGHYRGKTYLFVASERGNIVGVYDVSRRKPKLLQLLPTGIGPEGLKMTDDGLLAVTAEEDGFDDGYDVRSVITFFEIGGNEDWSYPQLVSKKHRGAPIPWVAISGLSGDPRRDNRVWAVSDSFLAQSWVYEVDVRGEPAVIRKRIAIGDPDGAYDLEGVAARKYGGFWLGSEGRGGARPNLIIRTDRYGNVKEEIGLPASLVTHMTNSGIEGVAVTGRPGVDEVVYIVIQRPWGDDVQPGDLGPSTSGTTKIGRYEVETGEWTFASYELDPRESPAGGWVGLSEVTALPNGSLAIIERDNQLGQEARIKRIYEVDPSSVTFAPHGDPLPVISKTLIRDVLGDLDAHSISVPDKLEGMALTKDGDVYLATDNDGVDENYGETLFFELDLGDFEDEDEDEDDDDDEDDEDQDEDDEDDD